MVWLFFIFPKSGHTMQFFDWEIRSSQANVFLNRRVESTGFKQLYFQFHRKEYI